MDYTDWVIFKTLLKEKNLTQTAEKLFITQPALTYRIKNLETELQAKLLIRTTRGVIFTSQGRLVAEYSEEMLKRYDEFKEDISALDHEIRGSVHVAVSPAFKHNNLGKLIKTFKDIYPLVNIYINTYASSKAIEKLVDDEVQIAMVRGEHDVSCTAIKLNDMPISLFSKEKISIKDLPNLPYIKYDTDVTLERDVVNWWRENFSSPPKTIMHLNDSTVCREMVESGLGFSILPSKERVQSDPEINLYEQPLMKKNGDPLVRSAWIQFKPHTAEIKAAKVFIEFIQEHFRKS